MKRLTDQRLLRLLHQTPLSPAAPKRPPVRTRGFGPEAQGSPSVEDAPLTALFPEEIAPPITLG
jgi:hypothetical protein